MISALVNIFAITVGFIRYRQYTVTTNARNVVIKLSAAKV